MALRHSQGALGCPGTPEALIMIPVPPSISPLKSLRADERAKMGVHDEKENKWNPYALTVMSV